MNSATHSPTVVVHGIEVPKSDVDISMMHGYGVASDRIFLAGNASADIHKLDFINQKLQKTLNAQKHDPIDKTKLNEFHRKVYGTPNTHVNFYEALAVATKAVEHNPEDLNAVKAMTYLYSNHPDDPNHADADMWYQRELILGKKQAQNTDTAGQMR